MQAKPQKDTDRRTVEIYTWFPRYINGKWHWLEKILVAQMAFPCWYSKGLKWIDIAVLDNEEDE